MDHVKNSHCSYCGNQYVKGTIFPKQCGACQCITYSNPLPVVVVMIPVREEFFAVAQRGFVAPAVRYGLLIQKRNIQPKKDEWALHSGYIDQGETWQQAAVRELQEEIGLETTTEQFKLYDVLSSDNNLNLLIFCTYIGTLRSIKQLNFVPNEEVSELKIMYEDTALAFPSHTECANRYLKELQRR